MNTELIKKYKLWEKRSELTVTQTQVIYNKINRPLKARVQKFAKTVLNGKLFEQKNRGKVHHRIRQITMGRKRDRKKS